MKALWPSMRWCKFGECRAVYCDCNGDSMKRINILSWIAASALLFSSSQLCAQTKALKEVRVPYALGGSTSFFWVAHRSGSFEKHGVKVLPIFMRGSREAVQALISRD